MENPIKMDDLGVPLFLETPIYPKFNPLLYPQASSDLADGPVMKNASA